VLTEESPFVGGARSVDARQVRGRHRITVIRVTGAPRASGRPVLGERGELELVCRRSARPGWRGRGGIIGDPVRVGQRFRETPDEVDPSSGWMPASTISSATWMPWGRSLERGRVGDRSHAERACRPQTAARHRAPCRATGDLHHGRRAALRDSESPAGGAGTRRPRAPEHAHASKAA